MQHDGPELEMLVEGQVVTLCLGKRTRAADNWAGGSPYLETN